MLKGDFNGSPFIGVFSDTTETSLAITPEIQDYSDIAEELGVDRVFSGTIAGSTVLGSMMVGNSNGYAVTSLATDNEVESLREVIDAKVTRVPGKLNALGNMVLCNDEAGIVSEDLSPEAVNAISDTLDIELRTATIAGLDIVGSAGVATNNGVLVHPSCGEEELGFLESVFGLPVDVGTVNYGTPLVASGLIANSEGYVAGSETTGPELGRIEEVLGFI